MHLKKSLLTILASGVATGLASADTIVADTADASVRSNGGSGQNTNDVLFAGSYYEAGPGITPVFPFLLPTLAPGASFESATLTLELDSRLRAPVSFDADIVGLDRIDTNPATITGADWGSDGTLLHEDFYTPASEIGVSTSNDFADWLNTQYADGANAGNYVFIRVDTDLAGESIVTGRSAYTIATADHADKQKPTIDFTVGFGENGFAITELEYNPDAKTVTLTWNKTGAAFYVASYSFDLTDWGIELEDNITETNDENPDDVDHITMTFPLEDLENPPRVYFHIEER